MKTTLIRSQDDKDVVISSSTSMRAHNDISPSADSREIANKYVAIFCPIIISHILTRLGKFLITLLAKTKFQKYLRI